MRAGSKPANHREIEVKLRLPGAAAGRRLLRRAGFRLAKRRVLEANTIFDTSAWVLGRAGLLLRLRQCGGQAWLTFKGRAETGRHKSREELEVELRDPATFARILSRLGFEPVFRYQKYRTEFRQGDGAAMLDETPIGDYLELEGEPEWIDAMAARLGFSVSDYITATYAGLYVGFRRQHPGSPADMLFAAP